MHSYARVWSGGTSDTHPVQAPIIHDKGASYVKLFESAGQPNMLITDQVAISRAMYISSLWRIPTSLISLSSEQPLLPCKLPIVPSLTCADWSILIRRGGFIQPLTSQEAQYHHLAPLGHCLWAHYYACGMTETHAALLFQAPALLHRWPWEGVYQACSGYKVVLKLTAILILMDTARSHMMLALWDAQDYAS